VDAANHSYARKLLGIDDVKEAEKLAAVLKESEAAFRIINPGFVQIDLQWYNENTEVVWGHLIIR
jgi:hypothetical protein